MENNTWHPFYYNGLESNIEVTRCGKARILKKDWMSKNSHKFGEIDFNIKKPNRDGYFQLQTQIKTIGSKTIQLHQIIASVFLGYIFNGHKNVVDHINNIKKDNHIDNLRVVTQRENMIKNGLTRGKYPTGVFYDKRVNIYGAKILINKKQVHLGRFKNEILASEAYQKALKSII